jgi:hypothetical protein
MLRNILTEMIHNDEDFDDDDDQLNRSLFDEDNEDYDDYDDDEIEDDEDLVNRSLFDDDEIEDND